MYGLGTGKWESRKLKNEILSFMGWVFVFLLITVCLFLSVCRCDSVSCVCVCVCVCMCNHACTCWFSDCVNLILMKMMKHWKCFGNCTQPCTSCTKFYLTWHVTCTRSSIIYGHMTVTVRVFLFGFFYWIFSTVKFHDQPCLCFSY